MWLTYCVFVSLHGFLNVVFILKMHTGVASWLAIRFEIDIHHEGGDGVEEL